jgi:hypothetical protein
MAAFEVTAAPNNGLHPTANRAAFIRQIGWLFRCAPLSPGVSVPLG